MKLSQNENATSRVFVFYFDYQAVIHVNDSAWLTEKVSSDTSSQGSVFQCSQIFLLSVSAL